MVTVSGKAAWGAPGSANRRLAIVHPSEPPQNLTRANGNLVGNTLRRLEKSGFVEGQTLEIERYCALGSTDMLRTLAAAAVQSHPDVILAISGKTVSELKRLTDTVPIVGVMSDPVAYGVVSSLSHPGGNVTGASVDPGIDIWVKRMALLKEAVPGLKRVFFVAPDTTWTTAVGRSVRAAAGTIGVELVGPPVENPHHETDYAKAFFGVADRAEAVLVSSAAENRTFGPQIVKLAEASRLPALFPYRNYVVEGGLMAHDIDLTDIWNRVADQIVGIFKGDKPGDLPIYQPKRFRFVINMAAAKVIDFEFSRNLIAMADEVLD